MDITVQGKTFAESLSSALNQIARLSGSPEEATLALPLRALDPDLRQIAEAIVSELLAEIEEGSQIGSVQIDGLMRRDGDYICWGYAYAAPDRTDPGSSFQVRDLQVIEEPGRWEIRIILSRAGP